MAVLHDVVVDCRHPASLARFRAAALDGYRVAPYDDAELDRLVARLVGLGASVVATFAAWTTLADPEGNEFCVRD